MKQAIAGIAPSQTQEVTVTIEWPTIAATGLGRFLGRLYGIKAGIGMFTMGRLFMALTWPLGLLLFFAMLAPWSVRRYRLTNRRVILEAGPKFAPSNSQIWTASTTSISKCSPVRPGIRRAIWF